MTTGHARATLLALGACVAGCAPRPLPPPIPAPAVRFQVLGTRPHRTAVPRRCAWRRRRSPSGAWRSQVEGGGLYGDVDLSEPHTVRLTLYDSLPGRPVDDPPPPSGYRQVVYQAEVGPLPPGPYDVWVGRFEPRERMVEVAHEPLRIEVERASSPERSEDSSRAKP